MAQHDNKGRPPQGGAPAKQADRTRDVEALAAALFAAMYPEGHRTKQAAGIARDAIAAAREFYRTLDTEQQAER